MGYHGVGIGGISVGGLPNNRAMFTSMLVPGIDHIPHTYNASKMRFSRGQPTWGAHLADELQKLVEKHGPDTIAAVIVEPMQGSAGVIVPASTGMASAQRYCSSNTRSSRVATKPARLRAWSRAGRLNSEQCS